MKKFFTMALARIISTTALATTLATTFLLALLATPFAIHTAHAAPELKPGDAAPAFQTTTHEGKPFSLASRKGQWTVLYFYPKADTPGCTTQACTYRDSIKVIRKEGAEIYGVSADTVKAQAAFHQKHHLNFPLLADAASKVIELYGTKMPSLPLSKRWTFIIDPELKIRSVVKDVDPAKDAGDVAKKISELKAAGKK